jgi:LysB family phage lysis regulatory protein
MTTLRQVLYGVALLGSLALLLWGQGQRIKVAEGVSLAAENEAISARADAGRNLATSNTLQTTLNQERSAQTLLRQQHDQLRRGLALREKQIEVLKRENAELHLWALQPLPAAARWLRERPAFTGADAYRQWLSSRSAMQPAGDEPNP